MERDGHSVVIVRVYPEVKQKLLEKASEENLQLSSALRSQLYKLFDKYGIEYAPMGERKKSTKND